MTPEQWDRVKTVFHDALASSTGERPAYVSSAVTDDTEVRDEVLSLLAAHDDESGRFERPLVWSDDNSLRPLNAGDMVGPWAIVREIGRGGMATVYEALHQSSDMPKRVAIKTVRVSANPEALARRFQRERRILATLEHPHIASLLDGGSLPDGRPWFALEFVEGKRIDEWCRVRHLDVRQRVRMMLQVCRAVQHAHERLIVHRDLKPSNILVTENGTVKLLDFGIAKLTEGVGPLDDTAAGALLLTADYASPEQMRGDAVTTSSDIYSLGVVMFEILSGVRPFELQGRGLRELVRLSETDAPRLTQVISAISARHAGFEDAARLRAIVGGDLDAIVSKALRKDPTRRYPSVQLLAEDLVSWLESRPVSAQKDTFSYRVSRFGARHRPMLMAGGAIAVLVVVAASVLSWQERRTTREHLRAEERLKEVRTLAAQVFDANDRLADVPGATTARATLVRTALASLDRASFDAPHDPPLLRELAIAYQRAGDVLGNPTGPNLGDLAGALAAYQKAVNIAEDLVKRAPDDVNAEWTLALVYEKTADAEAPSGKIKEALGHQRSSLALFRRVAAADSQQPTRIRAVGISALKLGDLLGHPSFTNTGDTSNAIQAYNESIERLETAYSRGDTAYIVRRHRAVARERLGRLMQERRDFASAQKWLDQSLALRDTLMLESPRSVQARRDVAIALYLKCGLHVVEQHPELALAPCQRSLEIRRALLEEDPRNAVLIRGMGIMHRRLGEVQAARNDLGKALSEYEQAIRYYDQFFGGRAGAINDRRDYAQALMERGALADKLGTPASLLLSERSYNAALASFDSIGTRVTLTPDDSSRIARVRLALQRPTTGKR